MQKVRIFSKDCYKKKRRKTKKKKKKEIVLKNRWFPIIFVMLKMNSFLNLLVEGTIDDKKIIINMYSNLNLHVLKIDFGVGLETENIFSISGKKLLWFI